MIVWQTQKSIVNWIPKLQHYKNGSKMGIQHGIWTEI